MRKKIFTWVFILAYLATLSISQADDIVFDEYIIDIALNDDFSALENITLIGRNLGVDNITHLRITLSGDIRWINIFDEEGELRYREKRRRWASKEYIIELREPVGHRQRFNIYVRAGIDDIIETAADRHIFSLEITPENRINIFSLSFYLPPGYLFPFYPLRMPFIGDNLIYPAAEVKTNGKQLIITWRDENVVDKKLRFFTSFQRVSRSTILVEDKQHNKTNIYGITRIVTDSFSENRFLPLILSIMFGFFLGRLQIKKRRRHNIREAISVFEENERLVIQYLLDSQYPPTQAKLRRELGFSKAKLSRILSELERRNIIQKISHGKTNTIVLNEEAIE